MMQGNAGKRETRKPAASLKSFVAVMRRAGSIPAPGIFFNELQGKEIFGRFDKWEGLHITSHDLAGFLTAI
jgi:hypothetical protein